MPFTEKIRKAFTKINVKSLSKAGSSEDEVSSIKLNLQGYRAEFSEGKWLSDSNINNVGANTTEMHATITRLTEENNLLKARNEILLQMLTEESANSR